jgi:hypothetical protein
LPTNSRKLLLFEAKQVKWKEVHKRIKGTMILNGF